VLAVLGLSGCETTQTIVIDSTCEVFWPISYSASQDTPQTVEQVRRHNARYLAVCGAGRLKPRPGVGEA